jgi:hypothetical protein
MAIGDDLFTMLGLIPSRDRAGIARGTMADEAKASMTANGGNTEGRALMDGGARPPDFTLPDGVGAEYASGKIRAPQYGGPSVLPPSLPPAQERIVAAGPAAAPPPEVKRNSDIIFEAMQKQQQAARLQQIIQGVGQMVSAARGQSSGGGGGAAAGGAAGGGVGDLAALLKMRDDETTKIQMVDQAQRMFGLSKQDAEARYASGDLAKLFDPATIAKREADQRAGKSRMELMKPEVVEELAKRTGMPKEVVETSIRNGDIDAKKVADILSTEATTAHTQATTGKVNIENMTALQKQAFTRDVMSSPEKYAELWKVSADEVRTAAQMGPEALQKLVEGMAPKKTDKQQDLAVENRMRREKGLPELTPSEYSRQSQQPHIKDAAGDSEAVQFQKRMDEIRGQREKAMAAKDFIDVDNKAISQKFVDSPKLLLGPFSEKVLEQRRFIGDMLKLPMKSVQDTDAFKAALKEYGLSVNKAFKGNFSDKDQKTVDAIVGGNYTKDTLRDLMELREKHKLLEWQNERNKLRESHADATVGEQARKYYPDVSMPEMGPIMRQRFEAEDAKSKAKGEPTALEFLAQNRDNPKAIAAFDREWGAGRAEAFIAKLPPKE